MKNLQIINKEIDIHGVHLIVKNKNNGLLHIEGHSLSKKNLGNNAILREAPSYSFPVDQGFVDGEIQ